MNSRHAAKVFLLLAVGACALAACGSSDGQQIGAPIADAGAVDVARSVAFKDGLELGEAAVEGVDTHALAALEAEAKAQHSDALLVVKNGKLVYEHYFDAAENAPIVAMSASKSFVSLAVGLALEDGKIKSLEQPAADFLDEWQADEQKKKITVRHLLTHTSGIEITRGFPAAKNDNRVIFHEIASPMHTEPGATWQYSNTGIDLLAAVVSRATGKSLQAYMDERLFGPIGAQGAVWSVDADGYALGAGDLTIRPIDMAKVGVLMLNGGTWNGQQLIPAAWVTESTTQSQSYNKLYGMLWWLTRDVQNYALTEDILVQWKDAGLSDDELARVRPQLGKTYSSEQACARASFQLLGQTAVEKLSKVALEIFHLDSSRAIDVGAVQNYAAQGWLGQFLVIDPVSKTVGVRMRAARQSDYTDQSAEVDGFRDFPTQLMTLVAK